MKSFLVGLVIMIFAAAVGLMVGQAAVLGAANGQQLSAAFIGAAEFYWYLPVTIVFAAVLIAGASGRALNIAALVLGIVGMGILMLIVRAVPTTPEQLRTFTWQAALIVLPVASEWGVLSLYRLFKAGPLGQNGGAA